MMGVHRAVFQLRVAERVGTHRGSQTSWGAVISMQFPVLCLWCWGIANDDYRAIIGL